MQDVTEMQNSLSVRNQCILPSQKRSRVPSVRNQCCTLFLWEGHVSSWALVASGNGQGWGKELMELVT